ncbi:HNH endonuclease domain-containing protein [Desulfobaculum sp. SPO524]|uniref:HNH endonuclease domain-containing protein n=1 Tax=Desulfobaculum sp. SPO524 TaxID=3378071 RepID=UPI00385429B5
MPTRRDAIKLFTVGAIGAPMTCTSAPLPDGVAATLSEITLSELHAKARELQSGDRILAAPRDISEKLLLRTYGFEYIDDADQGLLFQFLPARNNSIETISSILYDDYKVATYKIALLRALVDIASGLSSELVEFHTEDGQDYAFIPYGLVCLQWIKYYWPLVEKGIPQITRRTNMAFEDELREVMKLAKSQFGLCPMTQFIAEFKKGFEKSSPFYGLTRELMTSLRTVIMTGPVRHAGRPETFISSDKHFYASPCNLSSFADYISTRGAIRVPVDLFFEMKVFGNILSDAIAVKWAQESVRLSARRDTPKSLTDILPAILTEEIESRDQSLAREVALEYLDRTGQLSCVYSNAQLRASTFAMDHILPYSIFYNNDLWNLMPAKPSINTQKSDKIPSIDTLKAARTHFNSFWDFAASAKPRIFAGELRSTLGIKVGDGDWKEPLFGALARQADITAEHRGMERWGLRPG